MIKEGLKGIKNDIGEKYNELKRKIFHMDFMDIDKVLTETDSSKQNLFLLLGNTLGNFVEERLLEKIKSVMQDGDLLLVDNQLIKKDLTDEDKNNLEKMYELPETEDYLHAILENAELDSSCGKLYNDTSIEHEINHSTLRNGNCIAIRHNFEIIKSNVVAKVGNKKINLTKGTNIVVAYSKKYVKQALNKLLSSFFEVKNENCFYSENDEYALVLCKKTK
jgi:uncharacterized SAM-dependent methyltransferase